MWRKCPECKSYRLTWRSKTNWRCQDCLTQGPEWFGGELVDLSDERRATKTWLPSSDRDVTVNELVVLGGDGKPACVRHGAMNRIDSVEHLYRCSDCRVGGRLV